MTNKEINERIEALCSECDELHDAFMRTGEISIKDKIRDNETKIAELKGMLHYEPGMFAGVVKRLQQESRFL